MIIAAVTSDNFTEVTGHAGRCRRFLIYTVDGTGAPRLTRKLDLAPEEVLHVWGDHPRHPIFSVDAVLTASAGGGFVRKLARRGIDVAITDESDPVRAVQAHRLGTLPRRHAQSCVAHSLRSVTQRLRRRKDRTAGRAAP